MTADAPKRRSARQSPASWLVGAFTEAWAEVRVHRGRAILSLVGVAIAVLAITCVAGLGSVLTGSAQQQLDRGGGAAATIAVQLVPGSSTALDESAFDSAFTLAAKQYSIDYVSRVQSGRLTVQFANGTSRVDTTAVDRSYGVMHNVVLASGHWFSAADSLRLAPALIVNEAFWRRLGSPDLRAHPTVRLLGDSPITAVIIGVDSYDYPASPAMTMLVPAYRAVSDAAGEVGATQFEAWVPPALAARVESRLRTQLRSAVPAGVTVSVSRQDFGESGASVLAPVIVAVGVVGGLVLFLGALGLVNISLVTVRQRIREIGIRRSFGATAGRVFFAIMMESVVASFVAGVVGVGIAIPIVDSPVIRAGITGTAAPTVAFPIDVAVTGLVIATLVGALAGLLPAIAAVRLKVIDAIRY